MVDTQTDTFSGSLRRMGTVIIGGIAVGAIYAMVAVGFSLLWQTSRTINFAQGDFVTFPAFMLVGFAMSWSLPLGLALVATVLATVAVLGYFVRRVIISRLLGAGIVTIVVATLFLSLLIQNGFRAFWTAEPIAPPQIAPAGLATIAGVRIPYRDLTNLIVAAAVVGGLTLFLKYAKSGKALRAVAQNRYVAKVVGINVARSITTAFIINAALVAMAAMLIAPIIFVQYDMGLYLGIRAFFGAIIGGFNELRGALAGGLLVGVLETFTAAYLSSAYKTAIVLLVAVVVILIKPEGLLGTREVVEYK